MILKFNFLALFFIIQMNNGQTKETIFLDFNSKKIDVHTYFEKFDSQIFKYVTYENDTIILKTMLLNYKMGTLKKDVKNQLFKLLNQRNGVDTTKNMLIHYRDTLHKKATFRIHDSLVKYTTPHYILEKHYFFDHRKTCSHGLYLKKYTNVSLYHFYGTDMGFNLEEDKENNWLKDPLKLLRNIFLPNLEHNRYGHIIINPKGEYFVVNNNINFNYLNSIYLKLCKTTNWHDSMTEFNQAINY